jgi:hypothetical protein
MLFAICQLRERFFIARHNKGYELTMAKVTLVGSLSINGAKPDWRSFFQSGLSQTDNCYPCAAERNSTLRVLPLVVFGSS